jgi:hypothetical protein
VTPDAGRARKSKWRSVHSSKWLVFKRPSLAGLGRPLTGGLRDAKLRDTGFRDLSFGEALATAKGESKLVMALFRTDRSGPNAGMEASTWKDGAVRDWLRARAVAVRIDADQEPDLAVANKITGLPVMIFFKPNGTEVGRLVGYHDARDFIEKATEVLDGRHRP